MKRFEYAQPRSEREAVECLVSGNKQTAVLAGGTDLVGLMKRMVVTPDRVVNIKEIESLKQIESDDDGNVWIGAAVCLDEFVDHALTDPFPSVKQVIQGISSIQWQSQGTLVGELLSRPRCWYFRNGQGLLGDRGRLVVEGDNRYHAILGNRGAAKFVSASRIAPALITLGASVRILGPDPEQESWLPLASLYRTPTSEAEQEHDLQAGQLVTHVLIPRHGRKKLSAAYEVRQGEGPDPPLAAAAVSLEMDSGRVRDASVVLGQVAPVPWVALRAAESLRGKPVTHATAEIAGLESVAGAFALSENEYKIQLASVAVKRALLRAVGEETGGLDRPMLQEPTSPQSQHLHTV